MSEHQGISITNTCYDCMLIDDNCNNCQDLADARLAERAHEIVDEGNMQYKGTWSRSVEHHSASDWTASHTAIKPQTWVTKMTEIWDADNPFHLI